MAGCRGGGRACRLRRRPARAGQFSGRTLTMSVRAAPGLGCTTRISARRRTMATLEILEFPDPRLRIVAQPVTRFDAALEYGILP